MINRTTAWAASTATAIGATLWLASSLTNQHEPWDAPLYWELLYPLAIAACALLAYRFPARPWRWPLVLFEASFIAMCMHNGELGNLWPSGVLLLVVVALQGVVAATFAARFNSASAGSNA